MPNLARHPRRQHTNVERDRLSSHNILFSSLPTEVCANSLWFYFHFINILNTFTCLWGGHWIEWRQELKRWQGVKISTIAAYWNLISSIYLGYSSLQNVWFSTILLVFVCLRSTEDALLGHVNYSTPLFVYLCQHFYSYLGWRITLIKLYETVISYPVKDHLQRKC